MTTPSWKQPNSAPLQLQKEQRSVWWGLAIAMLAALGAGLCCAGPLLYLLFGLSAAGLGLWAAPEWLQWPLAVLALLLLIGVFWRLYLHPQAACPMSTNRYIRPIFWLVTVLVALLLSYPYLLGWWWS